MLVSFFNDEQNCGKTQMESMNLWFLMCTNFEVWNENIYTQELAYILMVIL